MVVRIWQVRRGRYELDGLLCRSLVVFCTFILLFAFRKLRRVMGEEDFLLSTEDYVTRLLSPAHTARGGIGPMRRPQSRVRRDLFLV